MAIAVVALALAPTTFLRDSPPGNDLSDFRAVPLAMSRPESWPATIELAGAWELRAGNARFGGLSTLKRDARGRFVAFTDRGDLARFTHPARPAPEAAFLAMPGAPDFAYAQDIESAIVDGKDGTIWLGHENPNAIRRLRPGQPERVARLAVMRRWHANSGLEAFSRLPDGRFLGLAERGDQALLFRADPVIRGAPEIVPLELPPGWRPSDMAVLPDGRVMVLLRAVRRAWPPFRTMLAIGDPQELRAGSVWPLEPLAILEDHPLAENYEGLAVAPHKRGGVALYLVSDDNLSVMQRTLLLELHWQPERAAARKAGARAPLAGSDDRSP